MDINANYIMPMYVIGLILAYFIGYLVCYIKYYVDKNNTNKLDKEKEKAKKLMDEYTEKYNKLIDDNKVNKSIKRDKEDMVIKNI